MCSHNSKYQWVFEQLFQLNIAISIVSRSKVHYRVHNYTDLSENPRYKLCLQRLQRNLRMLSTKRRNLRDCMILFTCYVQLTLKTQRLIVLHQQNVVHHLWFKLCLWCPLLFTADSPSLNTVDFKTNYTFSRYSSGRSLELVLLCM